MFGKISGALYSLVAMGDSVAEWAGSGSLATRTGI